PPAVPLVTPPLPTPPLVEPPASDPGAPAPAATGRPLASVAVPVVVDVPGTDRPLPDEVSPALRAALGLTVVPQPTASSAVAATHASRRQRPLMTPPSSRGVGPLGRILWTSRVSLPRRARRIRQVGLVGLDRPGARAGGVPS